VSHSRRGDAVGCGLAITLIATIGCRSPSTRRAGDTNDSAAAGLPSDSEIESIFCQGDASCKLVSALRVDGSGHRGPWHVAVVDHICQYTWLLEGGVGTLQAVQLLNQRCSVQGKPAISAIGPDRIREVLTETTSNAGVTTKSTVWDFAFDPPRVVREAHTSAGTDAEVWEQTWDFEGARGSRCLRSRPGQPCEMLGVEYPLLTVADPDFANESWKAVSLGDCGLVLDEFSRYGASRTGDVAIGTTVRALLTDWDLYVEVSDNAFVVRGKVVDRLSVMSGANDDTPRAGLMWDIFMDGRVQSTAGPAPKVEMAWVSPTVRRFKLSGNAVRWRENVEVVYEDTSDGITTRAYLATGHDDIGKLHRVLPGEAVCLREGDSLRVRRKIPEASLMVPLTR
jgi:hypothetical protein